MDKMPQTKFQVGDEVIYIGVWKQKVGTVCKVTDIISYSNPVRYGVSLDDRTGVAETSIRKLTKLEKALK